MNCFVTGATGFIGSNLVHELAARGHRVKAWLRPGTNSRNLDGLDAERLTGDLADRPALVRAMRGCDWCFHLAASYHLWLPDYTPMYATNVEGTRNVLEAAIEAGCSRVVYTSTVGCLGWPEEIDGQLRPADETTPVSESQMNNHYKLSKWRAESVAKELAARGAPLVIVNPSAPIGPRDSKPTPTGKIIVDFINGRMSAYLDTGLNWVDVRDVAIGHILAAEKGRIGERYILGNAEGNWTLQKALTVLAEIGGRPAPKFRLPHAAAWMIAQADEARSRLTGRAPRVPLAGVGMARHKMFFSPAKAIRELGLPQTPPRVAFTDAVEWFRADGRHLK